MKRSNRIKTGGNCSVNPVTNVPDCIPDVNMSQYKCPCSYLPLDGYKHITYPLSNNPLKLNTLYGGKKYTLNKKHKTLNKKHKTLNNKHKTLNNKHIPSNNRFKNDNIYKKLSKTIYDKYKFNNNIPIECLVSICLLLKGHRNIIQYDRYLYTLQQWNNITKLLNDNIFTINGNKMIKLTKKKNDIVVYLDKKITSQIEEFGIDSVIDSNLDIKFYSNCVYNTNKLKSNISRVSINVIGPVENGDVVNNKTRLADLKLQKKQNYFGQLLLMECNENEINNNIKKIVERFNDFKLYIWEIDPNLQLSLEIYAKNGIWENQPFLKTNTLTYTD